MQDFQLGFCLGLIAGEGSFSHTGNVAEYPRLSVMVHERDRAMLEHLLTLFGGSITGPYASVTGSFITWNISSHGLCSIVPIIEEHMPPCHKREQFLIWRERHRAYLDNPPRARLKYQDAEDIRKALSCGATINDMATAYDVPRSTIYSIRNYWTHLG